MRGNKTLVIIALVLIAAVIIACGVYFYLQRFKGGGSATTEVTPEYVPVETTEIVVALQDIPRGMKISVEDKAIALQSWPIDSLPVEYYTSTEEVEGKLARMEIPRGMPIVPDMIVKPGSMLSVSGSSAALFEPEDRVAYAIPLDTQGAIGWAIQPGDHVDVLAALKMKPVYTDFLDKGVKQFTYLQTSGEENVAQSGTFGDFELLPNGQWAAISPSDSQVAVDPLLLVQMTVQDAVVWHVGTWEEEVPQAQGVQPGQGAGTGSLEVGGNPAAAPTPAVATGPGDVELVTLLVTREDALILKYLYEMGADLDLVLRPAGMEEPVLQTQPVWFRYIVDKYQLPDTMPTDAVGPVPVHPPLELTPEATAEAPQE